MHSLRYSPRSPQGLESESSSGVLAFQQALTPRSRFGPTAPYPPQGSDRTAQVTSGWQTLLINRDRLILKKRWR